MTIFIPRTHIWGSVTLAINCGAKYSADKSAVSGYGFRGVFLRSISFALCLTAEIGRLSWLATFQVSVVGKILRNIFMSSSGHRALFLTFFVIFNLLAILFIA